jgi:hypothetical protein
MLAPLACTSVVPGRGRPAGTSSRRYGAYLNMMKPAHAATRRFLPTSPFKPPPPPPPAEQFAVQDRVTHDKYGLGRVISVEDDTTLVIDFGTQQIRITTPCAKLTKL